MPKKVFISFRYDDNFRVWSLRNLAEFKNVDFEFDDVSLREAVRSQNDTYIRSVIRQKIRSCGICLCMVGETTWRSRKWIPFEIGIAVEEHKEIIAMRFKATPNALTPRILTENNIHPFDWDLSKLYRKLL